MITPKTTPTTYQERQETLPKPQGCSIDAPIN